MGIFTKLFINDEVFIENDYNLCLIKMITQLEMLYTMYFLFCLQVYLSMYKNNILECQISLNFQLNVIL